MGIRVFFIILSVLFFSSISFSDIHIKAVGDIMLEQQGYPIVPGYLGGVSDLLAKADITFGNYEGTICKTSKPSWKCQEGKPCYAFRSSVGVLKSLSLAGFDILSIANNHIYDFGEACANQTVDNIEAAGIMAIGLLPKTNSNDILSARFLSVKGIQVGFIGLHYSQGWGRLISLRESERVRNLISEVKNNAEILIVSFHGGDEGAAATRVANGEELHYRSGEKRGNLRMFSKMAVEAGADLILGHGPHVPRGMEIYKNKLIAYSLGNFATPWGFSLKSPMNLGFILDLQLDERTGDFVSGRIIPATQTKNPSRLSLDQNNKTIQMIKDLTNLDFSSPLYIGDNGAIKVRR